MTRLLAVAVVGVLGLFVGLVSRPPATSVRAQGACDIRGVWHEGRFLKVSICSAKNNTEKVSLDIHEGHRVYRLSVDARWWGMNNTCDIWCRPTSGYTLKERAGRSICRNCARTSKRVNNGCDCGGCSSEFSCNGFNFAMGRGGMLVGFGQQDVYLEVSRSVFRTGCYSNFNFWEYGAGAFTCPDPHLPCPGPAHACS